MTNMLDKTGWEYIIEREIPASYAVVMNCDVSLGARISFDSIFMGITYRVTGKVVDSAPLKNGMHNIYISPDLIQRVGVDAAS